MDRLANFRQNNKRGGGCNKRGGWQRSPKLINGEAGKNKTIRNFIDIIIKQSCENIKKEQEIQR